MHKQYDRPQNTQTAIN